MVVLEPWKNVSSDSHVIDTPVQSRDLGDRVVIADGINGDQRLMVNPREDLSEGEQVRLNPPKNEKAELARQ